jgi:hypothetical protein
MIMVTRDQVSLIAQAAFLAERPRLKVEIDTLSEDETCGNTLEEYKFDYLQRELTEEANRQGLSSWDYQLQLAEDEGLDVSTLRAGDKRAVAKALGIDSLL